MNDINCDCIKIQTQKYHLNIFIAPTSSVNSDETRKILRAIFYSNAINFVAAHPSPMSQPHNATIDAVAKAIMNSLCPMRCC